MGDQGKGQDTKTQEARLPSFVSLCLLVCLYLSLFLSLFVFLLPLLLSLCVSSCLHALSLRLHVPLRSIKALPPVHKKGDDPEASIPVELLQARRKGCLDFCVLFLCLCLSMCLCLPLSPCAPQDPSARIGEDSVLGPNVTVDRDVTIGRGCRLKNCAIMRGVQVSDFSWIDSSILGWQSTIGKWVAS